MNFSDSIRDWPEDFAHENGIYLCTCSICSHTFTGHKRRVICKVCQQDRPKSALPSPLPCPFCGVVPKVFPVGPRTEGDAWGAVRCLNPECVAKPIVRDGEAIVDTRGSDAYKTAAILRWNTRWSSAWTLS